MKLLIVFAAVVCAAYAGKTCPKIITEGCTQFICPCEGGQCTTKVLGCEQGGKCVATDGEKFFHKSSKQQCTCKVVNEPTDGRPAHWTGINCVKLECTDHKGKSKKVGSALDVMMQGKIFSCKCVMSDVMGAHPAECRNTEGIGKCEDVKGHYVSKGKKYEALIAGASYICKCEGDNRGSGCSEKYCEAHGRVVEQGEKLTRCSKNYFYETKCGESGKVYKMKQIDTKGGKKCTLPYLYKGKEQCGCLPYGEKTWCATGENYEKDGEWDYCK